MLSVYTNQSQILNTTDPIIGKRFSTEDSNLLDVENIILYNSDVVLDTELHVYTPSGAYLDSIYQVPYVLESNKEDIGGIKQYLSLDVQSILFENSFTRGQIKIVLNTFVTQNNTRLWIKEISPSRRELRISCNEDIVIDSNCLLNFNSNETYVIVSSRKEGDDLYIKLLNPLPTIYGEKAIVKISKEIISPVILTCTCIDKVEEPQVKFIKGPNFDIDASRQASSETGFKAWNDILTQDLSTSQKIVDSYFSSSFGDVKLNIDYRIFDNFVHFSSAEERVLNFKYKLELIENFSLRIQELLNIQNAGPAIQNNLNDLYKRRNNIVNAFDEFERYLYFESDSSLLYSNFDMSSSSLAKFTILPWPKKTQTSEKWSDIWSTWVRTSGTWEQGYPADQYPYFGNLEDTNSNTAVEYFNTLQEAAKVYDRLNIHSLRNSLPSYATNEGNEEVILFIDMLGQHFDITWTYINHLSALKSREENTKAGMSSDLIYSVAKSFGFELINGRSSSDLWKYAIQNNQDLTDDENTKEIWRRIVNNLPYILKTKGTARSIKALVNCFGIPASLLTIKEYGGPSTYTDEDHFPEYVHDVYYKAWNTTSSSFEVYPIKDDALYNPVNLEFRFRTDENYEYAPGLEYDVLANSPSYYSDEGFTRIYIKRNSADSVLGSLHYQKNFFSSEFSINDIAIFDNSWNSVYLESNSTELIEDSELGPISSGLNTVTMSFCKPKYGKIVAFETNQTSYSIPDQPEPDFPNYIVFSPDTFVGRKFQGQINEVRLWSQSLNTASLKEHAISPSTYTFNTDRNLLTSGENASAPYDQLLQRYSLNNSYELIPDYGGLFTNAYCQKSIHPNQNSFRTGSLEFVGRFTNISSEDSIKFDSFEETFYTPSPSLGNNSLYSNKIRLEENSVSYNRQLNSKTRVESSSYDKYSVDSNKLGVYFSPQNLINEDIFNQLGYFEIDDYIGDPSYLYSGSYTALNNFANNYWKKYDNRNDFESYFKALSMFDFTLFKYIEKLVPARTSLVSGLTIEPNALERSKVKFIDLPKATNQYYTSSLSSTTGSIQSTYSYLTTSLQRTVDLISGRAITQYTASIDNLVDIDKLGISWVSNRYVENSVYTQSGSYKPIQTVISDWYRRDYEKSQVFNKFTVKSSQIFEFLYDLNAEIYSGIPLKTVISDFKINNEADPISYPTLNESYLAFIYSGEAPIYRDLLIQITEFVNANLTRIYSLIDSSVSYNSRIKLTYINNQHGTGYENIKFNGSKLSGPGVNIDTANTVDGGPVIRVTKVSPNRLLFSGNQLTTQTQIISGGSNQSTRNAD